MRVMGDNERTLSTMPPKAVIWAGIDLWQSKVELQSWRMIRYYKVGMGCKREDITAGQISGRVNLSAENMVQIAIWRLMHVDSKTACACE